MGCSRLALSLPSLEPAEQRLVAKQHKSNIEDIFKVFVYVDITIIKTVLFMDMGVGEQQE